MDASGYTSDEATRIIDAASRIQDPVDRDDLTYDEIVRVADELGIGEPAVRTALRLATTRDRRDARSARKRVARRMRFVRHAAAFVLVVLALALIDALGGGGWWFFYVAAIWGVMLALHALRFATRRRGPLERRMLERESGFA